jgi:hypothetical protein
MENKYQHWNIHCTLLIFVTSSCLQSSRNLEDIHRKVVTVLKLSGNDFQQCIKAMDGYSEGDHT